MALLVVGLAACAPSKTKAPERPASDKPYDFKKEGEIPPLKESAVDIEADVEEMPVEESEVVAEDVAAPKDTTAVKASGGTGAVVGKNGSLHLPILRVQILATSSEKSAKELKDRVESTLMLPAYISFDDGMYKVRVGDCTTRLEAEKVRTKCRQAGYTDAWIVTDVVKSEPPSGDSD
jgi:hypothetical protein